MEQKESKDTEASDEIKETDRSSYNVKCHICNVVENTNKNLERHLENHD